MKRREKGFVIEAVLLILVVGLATALVYLYADKRAADDRQGQADAQMARQMATRDKTLAVQRKAAAANLIRGAYNTYVTGLKSSDAQVTDGARRLFLADATPALAAQLSALPTAYDRIVCAQNVPASLVYGEVALQGAVATEEVMTRWGDGSSVSIKAVVDTDRNKLVGVICPSSPAAPIHP